jgi:hypothetical protein
MRGHTPHNLAYRLNMHRTGSPMRLAFLILVGLLLAWVIFSTGSTALAQTGGTYTLTRSVIGSGGGGLAGGSYTLAGTSGQPEAGRQTGGKYALVGGFWIGSGGMEPINLPLVFR